MHELRFLLLHLRYANQICKLTCKLRLCISLGINVKLLSIPVFFWIMKTCLQKVWLIQFQKKELNLTFTFILNVNSAADRWSEFQDISRSERRLSNNGCYNPYHAIKSQPCFLTVTINQFKSCYCERYYD